MNLFSFLLNNLVRLALLAFWIFIGATMAKDNVNQALLTWTAAAATFGGFLFLQKKAALATGKARSWELLWWFLSFMILVMAVSVSHTLAGNDAGSPGMPGQRLPMNVKGFLIALLLDAALLYALAQLVLNVFIGAGSPPEAFFNAGRPPPPPIPAAPALAAQAPEPDTSAQGNPYAVPAAPALATEACAEPNGKLELVRRGQRQIILALVLSLIANAMRTHNPIEALLVYLVALFPICLGIHKLANGLEYPTIARIFAYVSQFVPYLNFIVLVVMSAAANKVLREAGYKIGLLGAARK